MEEALATTYSTVSRENLIELSCLFSSINLLKFRAMEIYQEFLISFPGSIYSADVRKRFRTLRGDFTEEETVPVN